MVVMTIMIWLIKCEVCGVCVCVCVCVCVVHFKTYFALQSFITVPNGQVKNTHTHILQ